MLLKDLLKRVDEFDVTTIQPIDDLVEETDTVVGELPPELIRLYGALDEDRQALTALKNRLSAEARELGKNMTDALREKFDAEHQLAHDRYKAFTGLFWAEVKSVFPQMVGRARTNLRAGFKVAVSDYPDCDCSICRGETGSIPALALASLIFGGRR
jgi:hypothetical protein